MPRITQPLARRRWLGVVIVSGWLVAMSGLLVILLGGPDELREALLLIALFLLVAVIATMFNTRKLALTFARAR